MNLKLEVGELRENGHPELSPPASARGGGRWCGLGGEGRWCGLGGEGVVVEYGGSAKEMMLPLLWPHFWMMMDRSLIITVLPLYLLDAGLTFQDLGLLLACNGFGTVFGNIPAGVFVAKHGPRAANVLEGAVCCVAAAALSLPADKHRGLATAAVSSLAMGFAESLGLMARQTFVGATVQNAVRGRVASSMGGAFRLGCTLGPLAGGLIAHKFGARRAFLVQAACGLAHVLESLAFIPPISATQDLDRANPKGSSSAREAEPQDSLLYVAMQHWRTLLVASTFYFFMLCFRKTRELCFSMEGHSRGMSQASVGSLASVSFLVDAVCFPVAGVLMDSIGRTWTGAASLSGGAVALLLLTQEHVPLIAFALVAGLANTMSAGLTTTIGADIAPPSCRAQFLALYRGGGKSSDLLVPLTLGILAHQVSMNFAILTSVGVCGAGVAWAVCCMRETLHVQPVQTTDCSDDENSVHAPLTASVR